MAVIAIFIAKLFSVPTLPLGVLLGVFARRWWQIVVGSVVIAVLEEILLSSLKVLYRFEPLALILGILAAAFWAGVSFYFAQKRRNRISN